MHVDVDIVRETESLRRLKARYLRLLDTKQWAEWGGLFTEDAVLDHPANRAAPLVGRAEIVAVVSGNLAEAVTVHHGHTPEIDLLDATHAKGIWAMEDLWIMPADGGTGLSRYHGYGHYVEDYLKEPDGEWRIARLVLSRLHLETRHHVRAVGASLLE